MAYLNPLNWFRWFNQFFLAWLSSIQWSGSIAAVPAAIVILLMIAGTTMAFGSSKQWRKGLVDRKLGEAIQNQHYDVAELLVRRRIQMDPANRRLKLQLADLCKKSGKDEDAKLVYENLAFQDRDSTAAGWLLVNDFDMTVRDSWDADTLERFGRLSQIVLDSEPDNEIANTLRADYLIRMGKPDEAIPNLETLAQAIPMRGLDLARLHRSLGAESEAVIAARKVENYAENQVKEYPKDPSRRVAHAQALMFLDEYEEAAKTLITGFELNQDPRLRQAIAQCLVLYAKRTRQENSDAVGVLKSMQLVSKAAEFAPNSPAVLSAISDIVLSTQQEEDEQITALRAALLDGVSPGIAHFVRGTVAMLNDDPEVAELELMLAVKEMPESVAILNNLAVAKSDVARGNGDTQGLEEALKLVEKAIDVGGKSGIRREQLLYFYETRAQIRLALGQHLDAISDFERVLMVGALKINAHRGLSTAYGALGQDLLAEQHKEAAQLLAERALANSNQTGNALEDYARALRAEEARRAKATEQNEESDQSTSGSDDN